MALSVTPPYVIPHGIYSASDVYHLLGIDRKTLALATESLTIKSRATIPATYTGRAIIEYWCHKKQVRFTNEILKKYTITDEELRQLSIRTARKVRRKSHS